MSSSDSDSKDDNINVLREAADPNLMSDDMFSRSASETDRNSSSETRSKVLKKLPSQRYLSFEEHEADLKVAEPMRNLVYKKMSKLIEDTVDFVEISPKKKKRKLTATTDILKLLKDTEPINLNAESEQFALVRPTIRRRQIEPDLLSDNQKVQLALVDGKSVLEQNDVRYWKNRLKDNQMFKYKEKKGTLYLIEPENEFTKARKKNNWSESKIAKYKHINLLKNKPNNSCLSMFLESRFVFNCAILPPEAKNGPIGQK